MEDGKGKELVGDTPPPVEQNDNKKVSGETEIHKEPSRESEVITLRSYLWYRYSLYFILYLVLGKCDQEKVWRIVAKEDSFDIQG